MNSEKRSFDSCFEVFLADTPESKQIHYNLRYQVYCEEMGFEDKQKFPGQMEFDEWDEHSVHFIVRQRYTGQWLGALRLVYQNGLVLPFEDKCTPYKKLTSQQYFHSMELSRLCVIKEARRFAPIERAPYALPGEEMGNDLGNVRYIYNYKNQNRNIMWGLIRAAVVYSAQNDVKHLYFLVASSLAHCVKKEGFKMRQIGDPCHHRGERIPYHLDVDHILANPFWRTDFKNDFRRYSEITGELSSKLRASR